MDQGHGDTARTGGQTTLGVYLVVDTRNRVTRTSRDGMADKRQLMAVMFTDIQGYSAMMGADEATTVRVVREHRTVVRDGLVRHHGREIRTMFFLAPAASFGTGLVSFILANHYDFPPGQMATACLCFLLAIAWFVHYVQLAGTRR